MSSPKFERSGRGEQRAAAAGEVAEMAGYFTNDSMLRRVIGERVVGLSGPRALLMMAAHPVEIGRAHV